MLAKAERPAPGSGAYRLAGRILTASGHRDHSNLGPFAKCGQPVRQPLAVSDASVTGSDLMSGPVLHHIIAAVSPDPVE